VSICFRKIAADILGVRLMRQEIELQQPVFKAEINTYATSSDAAASAAAAAVAKTTGQARAARSSMCTVS